MKNCIPLHIANKMKAAFKSGELSIEALWNAKSSGLRREMFEEFVPKELARFFNLKFEKAKLENKKNSMLDWVNLTTTTKEKKSTKVKNILHHIADLQQIDVMNPDAETAYLEDVVSERLGVNVTTEEIKTIYGIANKIKAGEAEVLDIDKERNERVKNKVKWDKDFFKRSFIANAKHKHALTDMDKYVNGLTPTSNVRILTGQIGRGNMLTNAAPAALNTVSNSVQGSMQGFERRLANSLESLILDKKISVSLAGTNASYARQYTQMMIAVFHETGYDMSRDYHEDMRLGEHLVHSEGPTIANSKGMGKISATIRAAGRGQQKLVFKWLLGYSDVAFASFAAADSSSLASMKMAVKEGLKGEAAQQRALEIFSDNMSLHPQTKQGQFVRENAIADAEKATWTNKSWASNASMVIRDALNNITGPLQLGYIASPFIKTGANVIQMGFQSTTFGYVESVGRFWLAHKKMETAIDENDQMEAEREYDAAMRVAVRAGLGTAISLILAGLTDPDDFIGGYDALTQKQRDIRGIKHGVYNSIKIGERWLSLDYFGALGPAFVGMMYARKYGGGIQKVDTYWEYAKGAGQQLLQIPGMRDFHDLWDSLVDIFTSETVGDAGKKTGSGLTNVVRSRLIPGIVSTTAQIIDDKERQKDSKSLLDGTKATIPLWRETLPVKINQFTGDEVNSESWWRTLFAGSRVKTATESSLISEISRLDVAGFAPTVSPIERSSSKVKELKEAIGDKTFTAALKYYGTEFSEDATKLLNSSRYRKKSDEEKMKLLNSLRTKTRAKMIRKFKQKNRGRKQISVW